MDRLPIDDVLPDLLAALRDGPRALLIAPPGAGKTTRVAPALLAEPWCSGQILLLVPRRLAARAAAEYMARALREEPGATIGYATRLDSRVGKASRVIVMTHGVFLARLQADPDLAGVSAVLFDEVHERSLDSDLALGLALDAAGALRPDLRILAMSATLDGERFARLLGHPPLIESDGKSFPLSLFHIGRDATAKIEPQMATAIRRALAEHEGSLLAFLPGVAKIERTATALGELPPGIDSTVSTAKSIPPRSAPRSPRRRRERANWSSPARSPKPVSPSMTSPSSSIAASPAARATTAAPVSPASSPNAPAAPPPPSAPAAPRASARESRSACGRKPPTPPSPRTTRPRLPRPTCRACCWRA